MIDEAHALAQLDGDQAFLEEMIAVMLDEMRRQRPELMAAFERRDFAAMRACTHAQLPSLKLFGFQETARLFGTFEALVIAGDPQGSSNFAVHVASHWDDVIGMLGARNTMQEAG